MKGIFFFFFLCVFMTLTLCLLFGSCKNSTPEDGRKKLEAITEEECKELANNALKPVLGNLRDVSYKDVMISVQENFRDFLNPNKLYLQIIISGHAKGTYNGKDTTYLFVFHGRIPENLADKKEFDEDGYNISLKTGDGKFIYNNKEDVDSLNNSIIKTHKEVEEMKKKDFNVGGIKVQYEGLIDNSLEFASQRELTPDEIAEAVTDKIDSEGANMIKFYSRGVRYADYVYKTQCIIYVKRSEIYKVIGGRPNKI